MEYEDEGGSPGSVPEFGAIFMSNSATKKECFRRKLLGLPSAHANFVERVKAGMILFLFEFEKRELYGVYRASSDGAMDIVPHAFNSSGRQFPAQVRFTVIWYCKPLSEHEFRDAIRENYYSNKKFNFGLSEDQVHRLLFLCSLRKSENGGPLRQFGGLTSLTGKERILGNEKVSLRNRGEKFVKGDRPAHTINIGYNGNSPSDGQRPDNERSSEKSLGYDTFPEHEGRALGRKKGVAEGSMDLMEDQRGFDYDEGTRYIHPIRDGNLRDSSYSSRRLRKENQFLFHKSIETEDIENAHMNPVVSLETRVRKDFSDGRIQMREIRGNKHILSDDGFRFGKRSFENPQTELRSPIDGQRLFSVGNPNSIISANQVSNSFAKVRRISEDGRIHVSDRIKIGHSVDNGITPVISDRLDEVRRVTDDRRQTPAEWFPKHLGYGGKFNYQESQIHVDDDLKLIKSAVHSGQPLDGRKRPDDEYVLLKSGRVDNDYTIGNSLGLPSSTGYAYQPGQKQPSFNLSKPTLEAYNSLRQKQHKASSPFPRSMERSMYAMSYPNSFAMEKENFGLSYPTSRDSLLTRLVPYDPELPDINGTSHMVEGIDQHHNCVANNFASSVKPLPYCVEAEDLSHRSDGSLCHASKVPMHENQDFYDHCGVYREKMERQSVSNEIDEDPLFFWGGSTYDIRNISPFILYNEHALASRDIVNYTFQENVIDPAFSDHQDVTVEYGRGRTDRGASFDKLNDYNIGSYQDPDEMPTDSEKRTSVFARLSQSSRKHGQEQHGYMEYSELNASMDQVMETLFECPSPKITDTTKHSPLDKGCNREETLGTKRREKRFNQTEVDEPTMTVQKVVIDCKPASNDKENAKHVLKETRVVEFKRRSETKRSQNGGKQEGFIEAALEQETEGSVQKPEGKRKGEGDGKQLKRRKLVRPVFGKRGGGQ